MSSANSDSIEVLKEHETFLEDFVTECGVTKNYNQRQNLLINSGITTWIDLVPRLKMTEAILIDHGVTHKLALCILVKAEGPHVAQEQMPQIPSVGNSMVFVINKHKQSHQFQNAPVQRADSPTRWAKRHFQILYASVHKLATPITLSMAIYWHMVKVKNYAWIILGM
ncbi:hypothetical protein DFH28DRAFT_936428 [Melampsora americana]|nr:hypothetical protein DFH28DRAFT_936428 [Melampsora americana]